MGTVMIKCPKTGHAIATGMTADEPSFARMPVFFSRTFCPHCKSVHQWFAQEAWIHEKSEINLDPRPRRPAAHAQCGLGHTVRSFSDHDKSAH